MIRPTIYIHHDAYNLPGRHLFTVDLQHSRENYPKSILGYFTFYQYFIEKDGRVIHTRPDMDPDVVYKDAHRDSISVCLAGNFDRYDVTKEQKKSLRMLFEYFREKYGINPLHIKEHRDYQVTSCPGSRIEKGYFAWLFVRTQYNMIQAMPYRVLLSLRGAQRH